MNVFETEPELSPAPFLNKRSAKYAEVFLGGKEEDKRSMEQGEKEGLPGTKERSGIFLVSVILLQLLFYIVIFSTQKTAHHEDEYFSYGMANSHDRPFLYGSAYSVYDNYNSWMSGADFAEYISVQKGETFDYATVWENQAFDTHPPLYYALLHTISSFFADDFSWWWAFAINLAAFVISQIFLYRLGLLVGKDRWCALLVCLLWGFSMAGQNTQLFLRMYSMLTMFVIVFAWKLLKSVIQKDISLKKDLLPLMLITAVASLTQHLFLLIAFFLTLFSLFWMAGRKEWKKLLRISIAVLCGVLLSALVFPATVGHLLGEKSVIWHGEASLMENLKFLLILILGELSGILLHLRSAQDKWDVFYTILGLVIPALYIIARSVGKNSFSTFLHRVFGKKTGEEAEDQEHKVAVPILIFSILDSLFIISGQIYYGEFGMETDRYIMPLVPLLLCVLVPGLGSLAERAFLHWTGKKNVGKAVLSGVIIFSLFMQNINPVFQNYVQKADAEQGSVRSYVSGANCLLLCSPIYLPCFCEMLSEADSIYITLPYDEEYRDTVSAETLNTLKKNGSFYVMVDTAQKSDGELLTMLQYLADLSLSEVYYCTAETTHGERIELYCFQSMAR